MNDDFDTALSDLKTIIRAERLRMEPPQQRHDALISAIVGRLNPLSVSCPVISSPVIFGMARVTVQDAVEKIGNRFDPVLVAARRAVRCR